MADINIKIGVDISALSKNLKNAEFQLKKTGEKMKEAGESMAASLTLPILGVAGAALKSFADIQRFENGLTSMMGSAEAAAAEMAKLKEIAKLPGLDLNQAVKGSVRLQSVGISADMSRKALVQVSNAIALVGGGAEELDGVTLALQQIGSKGAVFAEEVNQINERLPQIRVAMKNAFGTSDTEELQEMGVTAEQFIEGVTVELGKLPRAVGGMSNSFANAKAATVEALAGIGKSLEENFNISGKIDQFAISIQQMSTAFQNLSPEVQKFVMISLGIVAAIGPAMMIFGQFKILLGITAGNMRTMLLFTTNLVAKILLFANSLTIANAKLLLNNIATKASNAALFAYNVLLSASNALINLFSINTIKAAAAGIAHKAAMFGLLVVTEAALIVSKAMTIAQLAYASTSKLLTGQINITAIAQKVLNVVLLQNPIGLVVVAVFALIAAFTAAYQNLDWFRKFVDNALKFIREKFDGLLKSIRFVFENFPAILKATGAALYQFVLNAVNQFKLLTLSAEEFKLKFQRALTIDKDARAELSKSIEAVGNQKESISKASKTISQAFKETLKSEMATVKVPAPKISTGGGGGSDVGGGGNFSMPAAEIGNQTKQIEQQKEEVKELEIAVVDLANAQELQGKKALESIEANENFGKSIEFAKSSTEQMHSSLTRVQEAIISFNAGLNDIVNSGLNDLAVSLGEGIGAFASGEMTMKQVAASMVSTLAGIMGQMGQLAIQTGIAAGGIKIALQSLNPVAAIAGGIALVALSKFVKAKMGSFTALAEGGILTKPVFSGGFLAGEAGPEAVIPLKKLDTMLSGGGASNMNLSGQFIARGRDLVYVFNEEIKAQNRFS
jgi:tape measure domain-containing protein